MDSTPAVGEDPQRGWAQHDHEQFLSWFERHPTVMQRYPRAWCSWNASEEGALSDRFGRGVPIGELALLHQRKPTSIMTRLERLGLVEDTSEPSSPADHEDEVEESPAEQDGEGGPGRFLGALDQASLACPNCDEEIELDVLRRTDAATYYRCGGCRTSWGRLVVHYCPKCHRRGEVVVDEYWELTNYNPFEDQQDFQGWTSGFNVTVFCSHCNLHWTPEAPSD